MSAQNDFYQSYIDCYTPQSLSPTPSYTWCGHELFKCANLKPCKSLYRQTRTLLNIQTFSGTEIIQI